MTRLVIKFYLKQIKKTKLKTALPSLGGAVARLPDDDPGLEVTDVVLEVDEPGLEVVGLDGELPDLDYGGEN